MPIKICLFLFSLSLYLIINGLFFNDDTMHKIYIDKGKFNFVFQIPKIIYSTIISLIIGLIIKKLALSETNILYIKKHKNYKDISEKIKSTIKLLKIKINLFFLLSFLFLCIFWYYTSIFCAVYENTQITLIKDTITSFSTSLIYPFLLNLIPVIMIIPALKFKNNPILYKFSKILVSIS